MSKQKANIDYKEEIKGLSNKHWPDDARIAIFGCATGNIGSEIESRAMLQCHGFTIDQVNLPDLEGLDESSYDGFVFVNSINHLDWIEDWSSEKIDEVVINSMTVTMKAISQIAKARMHSPRRTKIVVIGSMAHKAVLNGSAPYCAAKAGIQHFIRCVAYELAPKGFEVFCVNPSNVQGAPMSLKTIEGLARYRNLKMKDAQAYWGAECPMGSFLSMEEVSDVVWDLLVKNRRYLSGSAIDLIGGQR